MEQIAVNFTDWWTPKTWLTPKVTILDRAWKVYVTDWELKELGYGWYIYNFAKYSPDKVYLYVFDWWSALENNYDRYVFWWNELDAYSNKYSWGRTAAPYFTSINWRFDWVDKAIRRMDKLKYDDSEVKKGISEINDVLKGQWWDSFKSKLDSILRNIRDVQDAVVDTSTTNDWNSSKNFNGINGKLDLLAEYVVKMKNDVDTELWTLDENVAQRITESNANLNEWMSNRVTIEQLLQQVARLENKLNEVVDSVVQEKLSNELLGKYDIKATRKPDMSDEEMAAALWIWMNEGLNQGMEEGISEGMEMWMEEGMWTPREQWVNAPVDMQGIAEPEMPLNY